MGREKVRVCGKWYGRMKKLWEEEKIREEEVVEEEVRVGEAVSGREEGKE